MSMIPVLFGTETGNAEECANHLASVIGECGYTAKAVDMQHFSSEQLHAASIVFIVTSTTGEGEAPWNAAPLLEYIQQPGLQLPDLGFGVCGLGDRSYANFAQCGVDFDEALEQAGAVRVVPRIDCDDEYEEDFAVFTQLVVDWLAED